MSDILYAGHCSHGFVVVVQQLPVTETVRVYRGRIGEKLLRDEDRVLVSKPGIVAGIMRSMGVDSHEISAFGSAVMLQVSTRDNPFIGSWDDYHGATLRDETGKSHRLVRLEPRGYVFDGEAVNLIW